MPQIDWLPVSALHTVNHNDVVILRVDGPLTQVGCDAVKRAWDRFIEAREWKPKQLQVEGRVKVDAIGVLRRES